MKNNPPIHGLMASFQDKDSLLEAATRAHASGYRAMDAYSPFPVEGLAEALGRKPRWVPFLFLAGGACGCLGGYFMQWYAMGVDYPINIGGKPLNSWPMFIPITFELTVLGSALAGFFGVLLLNRFPEPYHPVFNVPDFRQHASRDGFFLCIEAEDPKFDRVETRQFLLRLNPRRVEEVEP
ncbi:MAG TPA: DUF3341 domain-containing protein [Verrucomicrobiae bacterium]|nr:DUF3341 domain-containing protein [Verrucomicrobiae bacterium]